MYCDVKEELSKKHWFSLVDYLKEKITLYELHSDKDWVKKHIAKKLNILNQSEKFDFFLRNDMDKARISFDVKEKNLLFTRKFKHNNVKCQLEYNTGKVNINTLTLFDFSILNKNFTDLINSLDDDLIMLFFKNICGLLSDDDFADSLIVYVKNNLNKTIEEWTLNNKENDLKLDVFPVDFYSPEFISKIRTKKNILIFSKIFLILRRRKSVQVLIFIRSKNIIKIS